jgi:hypothetical protein
LRTSLGCRCIVLLSGFASCALRFVESCSAGCRSQRGDRALVLPPQQRRSLCCHPARCRWRVTQHHRQRLRKFEDELDPFPVVDVHDAFLISALGYH